LEPGDHLDQSTFHARYEAMPPGTRAELIGGIVYIPSPVGRAHGVHHRSAIYWLAHYNRFTPGVESMDNGTTILAEDSEPQPDVALRVLFGGQTRVTIDGFVTGCPELVCEVANSSESYDLHAKRRDYERHGTLEYVAAIVRASRVAWFTRVGDRLIEVPPDADGIYRSRAFPGLWLDPVALLAGDLDRIAAVVEHGVATPAHAAFVADLRARQP
jgi:Uma2 family endonuclease